MSSQEFKSSWKMKETDFTRDRKLNFITMMNIMIRKSSKSLQNTLNELKDVCKWHNQPLQKIYELYTNAYETVTAGAYTRARTKLNYKGHL